MNKPPKDHDRLLAETFTSDWIHGPPAQFAQTAARHARRRRANRQALASVALAAPIIALFALLAQPRAANPPPTLPISRHTPPATNDRVTDQELLALINDRPVMLVYHDPQKPELVFLSP